MPILTNKLILTFTSTSVQFGHSWADVRFDFYPNSTIFSYHLTFGRHHYIFNTTGVTFEFRPSRAKNERQDSIWNCVEEKDKVKTYVMWRFLGIISNGTLPFKHMPWPARSSQCPNWFGSDQFLAAKDFTRSNIKRLFFTEDVYVESQVPMLEFD